MAAEKLPYIQFYPADWKKDPAVQALDLEHKGAWMEILLLAHETSEKGRLVLPNGAPIPDSAIAKILGIEEQKWKQMRSTLLSMGVASEDERGVLYNRRMVRDSELRRKRAEAGRIGGSKAKRKQNESNGESKRQGRARAPAGASSSVAVAVSSSVQEEQLSNIPLSPATQTARANGGKQQDVLQTVEGEGITARDRAARIFHRQFHLGREFVEIGEYRETLGTAMRKWDRAVHEQGRDPDELNAELELVRVVENFRPDEPITSMAYFGTNRDGTRMLCEAERLKRQPASALLPRVDVDLPPEESWQEKQRRASQTAHALLERERRDRASG